MQYTGWFNKLHICSSTGKFSLTNNRTFVFLTQAKTLQKLSLQWIKMCASYHGYWLTNLIFSYLFCRNIFNSGFKQHMFTRRSPEKFSRFLSPLQNRLYPVKFKNAVVKKLIYMDSTLQTTLKHLKNPVYFRLRKRCQIFLL